MLVTKKTKTVEESQIEISLPAYFSDNYLKVMITTSGDIIRVIGRICISLTTKNRTMYDDELQETIALPACTEEMFFNDYNTALAAIQNVLIPEKAA